MHSMLCHTVMLYEYMAEENEIKAEMRPVHFLGQEGEEMIPLMSSEEEQELHNSGVPEVLSILPVRNTVLFPGVVIPITVGRKKSIALVKDAYNGDRIIGVVAQKNAGAEDPQFDDLYKVGTVASILKMVVLPDGNTTIIIQGKRRFEVEKEISAEPYIKAAVSAKNEDFKEIPEKQVDGFMSSLKETAKKIIALNPDLPPEAQLAVDNIETLGFLTHFLSSNLNVDSNEKQRILQTDNGKERSTVLLEFMKKEEELLQVKQEIHSKVHHDIDQQQRDFYLRQQMKVLQDELGEESVEQEVDRLRLRGAEKDWSEEVSKHFTKELKKVSRMNPAAADYPVYINYLELLVDLPWGEVSEDNFNLKRAKTILDKDHYGLEKVKQRILEFLAVLKLKNVIKGNNDGSMKGPILCLYGPPGVGKTSLGKSIAKALNREYVRMALGGVRDEAEIRGHRKTYIGAMPGKVINNIKKVGKSNPVFVLDEIDKIASDFRGDPSSALLEVLDPEQNNAFVDNYLEVEYDLSKTLFIATANSLDTIQPALRDRMEIIEINGYTLEEKAQIAKHHLVNKQREEHGLGAKDVTFTKAAIEKLVDGYTRESGVRGLDRKIGSIMRHVAKSLAMEEDYTSKITPKEIVKILGGETFDKEAYESNKVAGIVTGLAWTSVGGEILSIESVVTRGKGKLTLSGKLGDVMKESAVAALSNVRVNADALGIDYRIFDNYDLHIHVPAGAVPKDGPSAGITMYTSIASTFTQRKVKEKLAMTGEITLTGKVLPVGGIKEKILAAKRAGIKEIIMCYKNQKDIDEIESEYIKDLTIHYVKHANEVLEIALLDKKVVAPIDISLPNEEPKKG